MNSTGNQYPNQRFGTYRAGARVGGIVIAFQCIVFLIFLGGSLMLIGTVMTAVSSDDPKGGPFDNDFFRKHRSDDPTRIIGPIFLSVGGVFIIVSTILCYVAYSTGKKLQYENQGGYVQQPIIAGATAGNMYGPHYQLPQQPPQNFQQVPYPTQNPQQTPYPAQSHLSQPSYNPEDQNWAPPPYDISNNDALVSKEPVKNY